jgi:hypothetical protein
MKAVQRCKKGEEAITEPLSPKKGLLLWPCNGQGGAGFQGTHNACAYDRIWRCLDRTERMKLKEE